VNYEAGKRLRMAETLYRVEDGHYMFKYPPFAAMLYIPVSFLPLEAAKAVWYFVVIICSFSLIYIASRISIPKTEKNLLVMILPPLILARYFMREIQLGQINALVTMVLLFMVWCLVNKEDSLPQRKEVKAGVLWGLGVALKPYALIFFPYFLIKKKWKPLLSGMLFIVLALIAPALFYGVRGNVIVHKEWVSTLSQSTPFLLTSQDNISIIALFMKRTGDKSLSLFLAAVVIALMALLILLIVIKGRKIGRASALECAVLLICIPLVSPMGWDYTLLLSILGVMIIVYNFFRFNRFWQVVCAVNFFVIAFSLYNILGGSLYAEFMSWNVITICFLIILGFLSSLRLRKVS